MKTYGKEKSNQTALEWLIEQVNSDCLNSAFIRPDLINKAKEMEKQQIINAYWDGFPKPYSQEMITEAEQYYNETFKSDYEREE